jgi:enamine deaminase RidA (YjgF/YER057c/UK114 family)
MNGSGSVSWKPVDTCDDLIFVSAQANDVHPGESWRTDVDASMRKISARLAEADAILDDIARIAVYYRQSSGLDEPELATCLAGYFTGAAPPALTMIPLRHLPQPGITLQIEAIGVRADSARGRDRQASPANAPHAAMGGFAHAVRCGELIFVGGQMSRDATGAATRPGDIVAQAQLTIANIDAALRSVGGILQDVVKLNTFYVGDGTTADWTRAAEVRSGAFARPGPGATGVPIPGPYPEGLLIRQDCIAVVGSDGRLIERETSWPESVWDWPIPVSFQQGLKLGKLLVLGGQVCATRTGQAVHHGDQLAQAILAGFGASVDDLAKLTILYATEDAPGTVERILAVVAPFFEAGLPAFTAIPLAKLGIDDILIEIEGIGALEHS